MGDIRIPPDGIRDNPPKAVPKTGKNYREVKVAQAIIRASRQVWLVADHSKFNRPAMVEMGRLDQVDKLFTDSPPPASFNPLLSEAGVACVKPDSTPSAPGDPI